MNTFGLRSGVGGELLLLGPVTASIDSMMTLDIAPLELTINIDEAKYYGPPLFFVDFTSGSTTPLVDQGDGYTYTRLLANETITEAAAAGELVKSTLAEEIGFDGQRRVENGASANNTAVSGSPSILLVTTGISGGIVSDSVTRAKFISSVSTNITWTVPPGSARWVAGDKIIGSVYVRYTAGDISAVSLFTMSSPALSGAGITDIHDKLSAAGVGNWIRIATGVENAVGAFGQQKILINQPVAGAGYCTFEFDGWQIEKVTGQTIQEPSEYVSVGVGTGSELVANPGFDDSDAWNPVIGSWTIDGTATVTGFGILAAVPSLAPIVGKLYIVSGYIEQAGSGASVSFAGVNIWITADGTGAFSGIRRATSESSLGLVNNGGTFEISLLSIKEIDHGSNVDGVKYFPYANDNSTTSNVVTEAQGAYFTDNKGVNVWEARTNYQQYSSVADLTISNGFLSARVNVTSNDAAGIDGVTDKHAILETADTAYHYVSLAQSLATGFTTTDGKRSLYVKQNGRSYITIWNNAGALETSIDLTTGAIDTGQTNTIPGCKSELLPSGWCKVSLEETTSALAGNKFSFAYDIYLSNTSTPYPSYAGDVTKGILLDAYQSEIGEFVTPYIPTPSNAAVTRNADELNYDPSNYSDEMTVLVEFELPRDGDVAEATQTLIAFGGATTTDLSLYIDDGGRPYVTENNSGFRVQSDSTVLSANTLYKIGFTRDDNVADTALAYINGAAFDTNPIRQATASITCDEITVGRYTDDSKHLNGNIYNVQIIPRALSAAELAAVTS